MKSLKGFVKIDSLINNTTGVVAPLGELSQWSQTFAPDVTEHRKAALPGYTFLSFNSIDSVTGIIAPAAVHTDIAIELVDAAITYSNSNIKPLVDVDWLASISALFFGRINNIKIGPFVDNGTISLPEWISWDGLDAPATSVRIWLSDAAFGAQYDAYTIKAVSPIPAVDGFFGTVAEVQALVSSVTTIEALDNISVVKNRQPETYTRCVQFDYVPLNQGFQPIPVYWYVLVYSPYGDTVEFIKAAIIEYILANSTHTRAEWAALFPSLFKQTEFMLLPRWDKQAIPGLSVQPGLYASNIDIASSLALAVAQIPSYPQVHINANISIFGTVYKSLSVLAIGGPDNLNNKFAINDFFSDYIPVPTSSLDFNRMSLNTRDWYLLIESMLIVAETANVGSTVPANMRIVVRDTKVYVTAVYNSIEYLVSARVNYGA